MIKDEGALKVFKEYYNKKCTYEAECRILKRQFEKEEQKLAEMEKHILDEHALIVRGQKLKHKNAEIWETVSCSIDWSSTQLNIKYTLKLQHKKSYNKVLHHRELVKGLEEGSWSFASDKDKGLAATTTITELIKHDKPDAFTYTYLGRTAKGKCIVLSANADNIDSALPNTTWKLSLGVTGLYNLVAVSHHCTYSVAVLGVYKNYQDLTFEFLL